MDVSNEVQNVLVASIDKVKTLKDEESLKKILLLTKDLLFCLDENKAYDYKLALIMEYLEGMQQFVPTNQDVLDNAPHADSKVVNEQIGKTREVILKFINPDEINPVLVTFWLQRTCNLEEIKSMAVLMVFLDKEQQNKILSFDKEFQKDAHLQLLTKCLPAMDS